MYNRAQHIHRGRQPQKLKSPTEMFIYVVVGGGCSIMDRWGFIVDIFLKGGLIILSNDTKYTTPMHVQSCPTYPPRLGINFVDLMCMPSNAIWCVHLCACVYTRVCVRIKKGVKADAAAKKAVKATYRIFSNAAGLSGASMENFIPLMDFFQSTTAQAILLVEGAMSHLPGNDPQWVTSALRVDAEHNWFALRSAVNRRQRALEHGEQMLVHTTVYLVYRPPCPPTILSTVHLVHRPHCPPSST